MVSSLYNVFHGDTVVAQLCALLNKRPAAMIAPVPRHFTQLVSAEHWTAYYKQKLPNAVVIDRQLKVKLADITKLVVIPDDFANDSPQFAVVHVQAIALTLPAALTDSVRIGAKDVKTQYDVLLSPAIVNNQQAASSSSALVNSHQASSSTQQQAMFQSFSTVPAAAMFDNFQIVRNPYSQYVVPTMYSLSDQQRIRNWDTASNYSFVGNGASYMQTLSLHTVFSRPMQVNDNIVFLYCPTISFTPDTPFDTIDKVTHVWYKVIDVQNDMVFFDKQGLLLNAVSSQLLPLHIKCAYEGTYLQFTPPRHMSLSLPTQQAPTVNDPANSASQRMANVGSAYGQSDRITSVGGHYGGVSRPHTVCQHPTSRDTQSTDSDSEDSQVRKRVKISTIEYQGKDFHVTGKENVLSILRDTHSVRTMMEVGQLEKLMQHEGNFVNHYIPAVWKAGILRQQSLAVVRSGMSLTVNEDHDLLRFQSLLCYDQLELQKHLYYQKYDFPDFQVPTSLHLMHYLSKQDAAANNYDIKTYEVWVKSWDGYRLVLKLLLGTSYGLAIAAIITDIQQNNIGKVFDVNYLIALTSTMRALLYQYSASTASFSVESSDQNFLPLEMTHTDWQAVIALLWQLFKSHLTFMKQEEYRMIRSRYNVVPCKPVAPKINKAPVDKADHAKQKVVKEQKERLQNSPKQNGAKKQIAFVDDIQICIADVAKHYNVATNMEPCHEPCQYVHYDQLPSNMNKTTMISKVKKLAIQIKLSKNQVKAFLAKVAADKKFK